MERIKEGVFRRKTSEEENNTRGIDKKLSKKEDTPRPTPDYHLESTALPEATDKIEPTTEQLELRAKVREYLTNMVENQAVWDDYAGYARGYAQKRFGYDTGQHAEDILQNTWKSMMDVLTRHPEKMEDLADRERFTAYVRGAIQRKTIDFLRHEQVHSGKRIEKQKDGIITVKRRTHAPLVPRSVDTYEVDTDAANDDHRSEVLLDLLYPVYDRESAEQRMHARLILDSVLQELETNPSITLSERYRGKTFTELSDTAKKQYVQAIDMMKAYIKAAAGDDSKKERVWQELGKKYYPDQDEALAADRVRQQVRRYIQRIRERMPDYLDAVA